MVVGRQFGRVMLIAVSTVSESSWHWPSTEVTRLRQLIFHVASASVTDVTHPGRARLMDLQISDGVAPVTIK